MKNHFPALLSCVLLFGKKEKVVLNLAAGGLFFSNLNPALIQPGTMQVDWVKVFTSN